MTIGMERKPDRPPIIEVPDTVPLWAFWSYDDVPGVLFGRVTRLDPIKPRAQVQTYGGDWFTYDLLLPGEYGERMAKLIAVMRSYHKNRMEAVDNGIRKAMRQVLLDVGWPEGTRPIQGPKLQRPGSYSTEAEQEAGRYFMAAWERKLGESE